MQQMQDFVIQSQEVPLPELTKLMRDKYPSLDSQFIYNECKKQQKGSHKSSKISNQFWDKLANIKPRLVEEECNDPETTR